MKEHSLKIEQFCTRMRKKYNVIHESSYISVIYKDEVQEEIIENFPNQVKKINKILFV